MSDFADGFPVVGHIKGAIHYIARDKDGGDKAMKSASRTTGVMAGGVGGFFVGGPVGAVAGGIAGGLAMDEITTVVDSVVHKELRPSGYVAAIENVISNPNAGDIFDTVLMPVFDGMAGYSAGQFAGKIAGKIAAKAHLTNGIAEELYVRAHLTNGIAEEPHVRTHLTNGIAEEPHVRGLTSEIAALKEEQMVIEKKMYAAETTQQALDYGEIGKRIQEQIDAKNGGFEGSIKLNAALDAAKAKLEALIKQKAAEGLANGASPEIVNAALDVAEAKLKVLEHQAAEGVANGAKLEFYQSDINRVAATVAELKAESVKTGSASNPKPVIQPATDQPVIQPAVRPIDQPIVQPVIPPAVRPIVQPVIQPAVRPIDQPIVQPVIQPAVRPIDQPIPAVRPIVQPVIQPAVRPIDQPIDQPVFRAVEHQSNSQGTSRTQTTTNDPPNVNPPKNPLIFNYKVTSVDKKDNETKIKQVDQNERQGPIKRKDLFSIFKRNHPRQNQNQGQPPKQQTQLTQQMATNWGYELVKLPRQFSYTSIGFLNNPYDGLLHALLGHGAEFVGEKLPLGIRGIDYGQLQELINPITNMAADRQTASQNVQTALNADPQLRDELVKIQIEFARLLEQLMAKCPYLGVGHDADNDTHILYFDLGNGEFTESCVCKQN
ncbi:hypothetical protein WR25_14784 isoform B [Diploscapter pachys]|uniref:Uncharacterized protein n=1 Tax=Diploscapter pachys TaxID=2018661 RepID=A0A2A2LHK9_9BILA|nr:hypothetical protein WR25_14784 isoform B [Diploscapter pachys]